MQPEITGKKYDKIARWWHEKHNNSQYGLTQFKRAINFRSQFNTALDVGCGAGGRFIRLLQEKNVAVTGIDVSEEMISLAIQNHPGERFLVQDICTWETDNKFDFIVAWDSIFRVPLAQQKSVVTKLCKLLQQNGVLIYTFGDGEGEHTDKWHNDTFYYSTLGINKNLKILANNGVTCKHLELDQWPYNHVYLIGIKC